MMKQTPNVTKIRESSSFDVLSVQVYVRDIRMKRHEFVERATEWTYMGAKQEPRPRDVHVIKGAIWLTGSVLQDD